MIQIFIDIEVLNLVMQVFKPLLSDLSRSLITAQVRGVRKEERLSFQRTWTLGAVLKFNEIFSIGLLCCHIVDHGYPFPLQLLWDGDLWFSNYHLTPRGLCSSITNARLFPLQRLFDISTEGILSVVTDLCVRPWCVIFIICFVVLQLL